MLGRLTTVDIYRRVARGASRLSSDHLRSEKTLLSSVGAAIETAGSPRDAG